MTLVINDRNSFIGSENYPAKTVNIFTELGQVLEAFETLSLFCQDLIFKPVTVLPSCVDCTNLLYWQATAF